MSGLVVLDVDLPEGPASLARLEAGHGPLPATCAQRTGSGGRQLLFTHPGEPLGNRARLQPGLDVRGDGGYIVVPPSTHVSGGRYRWTGRMPPAAPPGWLLELLDRSRTPDVPADQPSALSLPAGGREEPYAAAALHRELTLLASAVEGCRNDTPNRAARPTHPPRSDGTPTAHPRRHSRLRQALPHRRAGVRRHKTNHGYHLFRRRGLGAARSEWALINAVHNLGKLHRAS